MYEKHEMDVVRYEDNNAFAMAAMSDGGSVVYPWSINPDRSDS